MARPARPSRPHRMIAELISEERFHRCLDTQDGLAPARPRIIVRNDGESRRELERIVFSRLREELGDAMDGISEETLAIINALIAE